MPYIYFSTFACLINKHNGKYFSLTYLEKIYLQLCPFQIKQIAENTIYMFNITDTNQYVQIGIYYLYIKYI